MQEILMASGVGLIWGITNPFLEQGAKAMPSEDPNKQENSRFFLVRWAFFVFDLLLNYKFAIPFLLNQLGSVLFYYALGNSSIWRVVLIWLDITFIVPVSNCISFTTTYICECLLKNNPIDSGKTSMCNG